MRIEQKIWTKEKGWVNITENLDGLAPQLVLVFGSRAEVSSEAHLNSIKSFYPEANRVICSSAGEIADDKVRDDSLSVTAIHFETTKLSFETGVVMEGDRGKDIGAKLAQQLQKEDLRHVLVLCDGISIDGTSLVSGISKYLPPEVSMTGGLAGDGTNFSKTILGLNDTPQSNRVILIGLYGPSIQIGYGSLGGWDSFGPVRLVTKSKGNILYELDGKPALDLYKKYLGDLAKDLPTSGLLFPLNLHLNSDQDTVVRSVFAVSEEEQSMTFSGDLPEGSYVNLMKANFDKLVDGADGAASMSLQSIEDSSPDFALLISCIGRKLVLKSRIEEETEAVKKCLGGDVAMAGFYSYGEISPVAPTEKQCRLHNQTMTITTFKEV